MFLPGKPHGQRSLGGFSPWGHKELHMTEQLHFHLFHFLSYMHMNIYISYVYIYITHIYVCTSHIYTHKYHICICIYVIYIHHTAIFKMGNQQGPTV